MAKILYIEARKKFGNINYSQLDKLPGKTISLAATVQYLDLIPKVKKYLESQGKKVIIKKGAFYKAQVLGCNSNAFDKKADTLLLVTDGKFHALNNAVQLNREIYVFNTQSLEKVIQSEIDKVVQHQKAAAKKFLTYNNIGILISTKTGQNYKPAKELKRRIEKLGKKVYVFEADSISMTELENFPIQIWVNTACYGLSLDDSCIVNLSEILEFI